jgi:hypothetical protein
MLKMAINRRELLIGLGAGLLAAGIGGGLANAQGAGRWVLYVSAPDCMNCRHWEGAQQVSFVQGLRKNGIGFRNLTVGSLHDVRNASYWPGDLRWIRDRVPQMSGTPYFFLVNGNSIELTAIGTEQWQHLMARYAA